MNESLRELLARGADTVERPALDVADLVAQAEHRLVRRRLGVVAASAAAVAVIAAGGLALRPDDGRPAPAPPEPAETSKTPDAKPDLAPAVYFDALAVDGNALTDPIYNISGPKDLYVTREGGRTRQVVATGANEHCPRVSPDGDLLAYLEGTTVVVRRLDPNGYPGATTALVRHSSIGSDALTCPLWSPRGRQLAIAVSTFDDGAYEQVFEVRVIDADGTERLAARQQGQWMPLPEIAWSPDGDAIAYTTPDSVWVAPLDGGEPSMLWQGRALGAPSGFPPYPGRPVRLGWLATGKLAVSAQTDVDEVDALHLVDPDSGRDQAVGTFPSADPSTWSWSPDGSRLVFSDHDGGVRMLDLASGKAVPLRPRLQGQVLPIWRLAWSGDGRRLVGTAGDADPSTVGFALISMDLDGSSVEVLTPWTMALYSEADPSWSPR